MEPLLTLQQVAEYLQVSVKTVRRLVAKGRIPCVHLKDMLIKLDRTQYMAEVGEGNLNWARILPAYFEALRRVHDEEVGKLTGSPREYDPRARYAAAQEARTRALEEAFAGVDLDEIEGRWREYVRGL